MAYLNIISHGSIRMGDNMLALERRKLILQKVYEQKKVIVSELSKEFDVSEETIRRDLEKLADEGHVIKSYGGAVINEIGSIDLLLM